MNERIQALLLRLAEDAELRARFVENGRAVMEEAGIAPAERAEVVRHVGIDGHPHSVSIVPTEEKIDVPDESASTPMSSGALV
jgi:hypothetical protein